MAGSRYDDAARYELLVSRAADFRSTDNFLAIHAWFGFGLRLPDVFDASGKSIDDFRADANRLRETRDELDPLRHKCNGLFY